jgi:hypothetical protein
MLQVLFTEEENNKFERFLQNSAYRMRTELARRLLLGKPVRVYYRDRAFDQFIEEVIDLRKQLALVMQRQGWSESEKAKMQEIFKELYELHIKLFEYVRKNKQNEKCPENTTL